MPSVRRQHSASPAKDRSVFSTNQGELFQQLDELDRPADLIDLDIDLELRGAIAYAIRDCRTRGLSREHIVDRMNTYLAGSGQAKTITLRQLNAWTAASKEYHDFPARYLPAFCAATDCDLPLRVLARALKLDLVDVRDMAAMRLGENIIQAAQLRGERRVLQSKLGG